MSGTARVSMVVVSLLIIAVLFVTSPPGRAILPENRFDWLKHFQILPVHGAQALLVTGEANQENEPLPEKVTEKKTPPVVKGIYLTSWMTGSSAFRERLVPFIQKTEINAVVIDVKDDDGRLSYRSKVPMVTEIGSDMEKFNPTQVIKKLKEDNVYLIARIVTFKDPFLAKHKTEWAVRNRYGGLWQDRKGLYWVDPYNRQVWEYNVAIAKEAAQLGFDEIQFDYVRFTSDGVIRNCVYPKQDERVKADVIGDFLKYASSELHPLGVRVSADVFGLVCSMKDDMNIGQVLEKIAPNVDIICPMVYPSHYYRGSYNIADPDSKPYETVLRSLKDAKQRLEAQKINTIIRPWLQDFTLRSRYDREQLQAQKQAVKDAGLQEWIFWNPRNNYQLSKYDPDPGQ